MKKKLCGTVNKMIEGNGKSKEKKSERDRDSE